MDQIENLTRIDDNTNFSFKIVEKAKEKKLYILGFFMAFLGITISAFVFLNLFGLAGALTIPNTSHSFLNYMITATIVGICLIAASIIIIKNQRQNEVQSKIRKTLNHSNNSDPIE
jgi:uncharacterized membrane protein